MSEAGVVQVNRLAVIGGGVAAMASAVAAIATARARGKALEVTVFEGHRPDAKAVPALLTPECRSRLAALGCRIPPDWHTRELRGVEIVAGGQSELFAGPSGGIWVLDGWPNGESGQRILSSALAEVAAQHGARIIPRAVDRLTREPASGTVAPGVRNATLLVRARGAGERFHATILAEGPGAGSGPALFKGYRGPPTLPAVQARLRYAGRPQEASTLRLLLNPLPGVDGLFLLPCATSVFALAYGPSVEPADFCQAVMGAARDGFLDEGFEMAELEGTRAPCGVGRAITGRGQLAVGAAALGHPFQIGVADTLAGASRAAHALIEAMDEPAVLRRRYVTEGLSDLVEDARAVSIAQRWLRRAGPKAAQALVRARRRSAAVAPFSGGVLGLPSPAPLALLGSARWAGLRQTVRSVLAPTFEPLPTMIPALEQPLFYVVDDDPDARGALTDLLEASGAKVVAFADELALYCAVARRPPTAILLDVVLNWVDGLTLCEGLKRHPLTRNTEVVVMSGLSRPHIRHRALEAGAKAFLSKPIDPERLLALLDLPALAAPAGEASAVGASSYESSA